MTELFTAIFAFLAAAVSAWTQYSMHRARIEHRKHEQVSLETRDIVKNGHKQ